MKNLLAGLFVITSIAAGSTLAQDKALVDLDTIQRLAGQGEYADALGYLDERIEADGNDIQSRFLKGLVLMGQGDTQAAREAFQEVARLFPRLPESYNNLAVIYAEVGEYEKARQALLSAAANAPEYAPVRANLGDLYSKLAADAYRNALDLDPDDAASQAKLKWLERMFASDG